MAQHLAIDVLGIVHGTADGPFGISVFAVIAIAVLIARCRP